MPIKSVYVPPQAIQGEDVPAHILWDSTDCCLIRILTPEPIRLKEIYNVNEGMYKTSNEEITVEEVAVNGYLGLLFSTHKLCDYSRRVNIVFSFFDKAGNKITEELKTIHLFRPKLEVLETPQVIEIDPEKSIVRNRIKVRKLGQGTLIINFHTPKESEVQKRVPDSISEFLSNVKKDLETNLNEVKSSFPKYSDSIDHYIYFIVNSWNSYNELGDLRTAAERLYRIIKRNEEFGRVFFKAMAEALVKNLKFFSLPESLLKYLDSVLSHKVWLVQPWQIIPVAVETKTLILDILPTDLLLNNDYDPSRLPKIKIKAVSDGYIEIARLFEWR
jgi:hypothetical protein